MRLFKVRKFGDVNACELGGSPFGRPMMTVYCFVADDLMVDAGLAHMRREALEFGRSHNIGKIVLTHHHEDHSGNAAAIKDALGVPVYGHSRTVLKMKTPFPIYPYQHYMWGKSAPLEMRAVPESIETENFKFHAVHAPGHSRDHTVYHEPNRGIVFSGDLYLSDRIKYFRADEVIFEQIESLRKIRRLDFDMLLCGHHPKATKGKERIAAKLQFLEDLYGGIGEFWKRGYGVNGIFREMKLKEQHFVKWFCFGNVSMKNVVRSAVRSLDALKT